MFPSELDSLKAVWEDRTLADTSRLLAILVYSNRRWLKCTHDSLYLTGVQMYELAETSGNMFYKSFGLRNQVYAKLYSREYDECKELLLLKMQIDSTRGNDWWVATNYCLFAELAMYDFEYNKSLDYLDKSYALWIKMDAKKKMAFVTNYKGIIYHRQGDYLNALQYYQKAVEIAKISGSETSVALYKSNIGSILAEQGNYKEALSILYEAIEIHKKKGNQIYVAMDSEEIGRILSALGKYQEARLYYNKNIEVYNEIHLPDIVARTKLNVGNDLVEQGRYAEAFDLYQESLEVFESFDQKEDIATVYNRIGYLNYHIGNYDRALEYYNKSMAILNETENTKIQANILRQIGQVYDKLNNYTLSFEYYFKSLEYSKEKGFKNIISDVYHDLGVSFQAQNDNISALDFYTKSRIIREEIGDIRGKAEVYINIGSLMFANNKPGEGILWCKKGYYLAVKIGVLKLEMEAAGCLYKAYKKLGNSSVALNYHERYRALEDSLNTDEADGKLQQMEFDRKKMEDSLAMVEQNLKTELVYQQSLTKEKNTRNTIMFLGIGVLLLAGGVFARMLYIRKTNKKLEEKNMIIAKEKERAEESEKAKEQFFDNISHEFRTPLTLILGPLNEAMNSIKDKHTKSNLEMMKRNAVRLQGMINELLHLSKLEFGKIKLQATEENIVKITEDYLQSFESLADQRKISLSFKSTSSDIPAYIDVKNYNKILANLLSNAMKFTREGGKVEVGITPLAPLKE